MKIVRLCLCAGLYLCCSFDIKAQDLIQQPMFASQRKKTPVRSSSRKPRKKAENRSEPSKQEAAPEQNRQSSAEGKVDLSKLFNVNLQTGQIQIQRPEDVALKSKNKKKVRSIIGSQGQQLLSFEFDAIHFYDLIDKLKEVSRRKLTLDEKSLPSGLYQEFSMRIRNKSLEDVLSIVLGMFGLIYERRQGEYFITLAENLSFDQWDIYLRDKALDAYQRFVRFYPLHPDVQYAQLKTAKIWLDSGKLEEALRLSDQLLKDYTRQKVWSEAQFIKAQALYRMERYDDARAAAYLVVDFYSKSDFVYDSLFIITDTYNKIKNYSEALKVLFRMEKKNDGKDEDLFIKIRIKMAALLYEQQNYAAAIAIYKNIIKMRPYGDAGEFCRYRIGKAYFEKKDYIKCYRSYAGFLSKFPQNRYHLEVSQKMAMSYFLMEKFAQSGLAFDWAIEQYSDDKKDVQKKLLGAAQAYFSAKMYDSAIDRATRALEMIENRTEQLPYVFLKIRAMMRKGYLNDARGMVQEYFKNIEDYVPELRKQAWLIEAELYELLKEASPALEHYLNVYEQETSLFERLMHAQKIWMHMSTLKKWPQALEFNQHVLAEILQNIPAEDLFVSESESEQADSAEGEASPEVEAEESESLESEKVIVEENPEDSEDSVQTEDKFSVMKKGEELSLLGLSDRSERMSKSVQELLDRQEQERQEMLIEMAQNSFFYWAENLFAMKLYDRASRAYQFAIESFPEHSSYLWARYQIGRCEELIAKEQESIKLYQGIDQEFPGLFISRQAKWEAIYLEWLKKDVQNFMSWDVSK